MSGDDRHLKVLHIDPERAWGGGETQVIGLLNYLLRRGHQNHLLCFPRGSLFKEAERRGIEVFPVTIRNGIDLWPIFSIRRMIQSEGYDIVHFHTRRAHALCLFLGRAHPGVKYVVTRRMDYPVQKSRYNRYLYNRRVDGVVAISEMIAGLLIEGGVKKEKIRVIHSGVDPAPFEKARRPTGNSVPVIGTVAVLEERKGHRTLLEAAAQLKRQGHRLRYRFAGEGSEKERLQKIVRRAGLQGEVDFAGFVSDVPGFLATVDIFILPSLYEGLGIAVLEAMAAGKPVIATRVGGLPEMVEDQVTGLLVPPADPQALARSVSHLLSQESLTQQIAERAWRRVQERFTLERMAQKNEEFYHELLQGHES